MAYLNRTYRIEDGVRIEGSWRHIFIKNGNTYFLSNLTVYANGMIDCWGLVDFATFQQKVVSGWVATTFPQGAQASAHHLGSWRFDQPWSALTPQQLIVEVADEIEHLAGRPNSSKRCLLALDCYLDEMSEANLAALRDAYLAVPEHLRIYLLGDMDVKDMPLRILLTPVGEILDRRYPLSKEGSIQVSDHESALRYFRRQREEQQRREATPQSWEGNTTTNSPVSVDAHGWVNFYLSNDYAASILIDGHTYPTVEHAYWALATSDPDARERIITAPTASNARATGLAALLRPNWSIVRLAVMSRLVREKFRQHPDLAAQLIATGDGRINNDLYTNMSGYWGVFSEGRNWLGRILELVRAELVESASS